MLSCVPGRADAQQTAGQRTTVVYVGVSWPKNAVSISLRAVALLTIIFKLSQTEEEILKLHGNTKVSAPHHHLDLLLFLKLSYNS